MLSEKMALCLPINSGIFKYSHRLTGAAWSVDELMTRGVSDTSNNFVSPVCDELRITCDYTQSHTFNRVHFSELSKTENLVFEISAGIDALSAVLTKTQDSAGELTTDTQNQTIRFADTIANKVQITITGIGASKLDIANLMIGALAFQPEFNPKFGGNVSLFNSFARSSTQGANYQKIGDSGKAESWAFWRIREHEYKKLAHLVNYLSSNGLFLFERSTNSEDIDDSYLAIIGLSDITRSAQNVNDLTMNVTGVYK